MAKEDVERFVGLLVSDDNFVTAVKRDFNTSVRAYKLNLSKPEATILRESIENYTLTPDVVSPGGTVMAVGAAVGAAVAAAVAGNVATKVADKLMDSKIATPINLRIRDSLIHRGLLEEGQFEDLFEGPMTKAPKK